jgi:hypothetical protein
MLRFPSPREQSERWGGVRGGGLFLNLFVQPLAHTPAASEARQAESFIYLVPDRVLSKSAPHP